MTCVSVWIEGRAEAEQKRNSSDEVASWECGYNETAIYEG